MSLIAAMLCAMSVNMCTCVYGRVCESVNVCLCTMTRSGLQPGRQADGSGKIESRITDAQPASGIEGIFSTAVVERANTHTRR